MARTTLQVCVGNDGIEVGILTFESEGNREHSNFQYSESWLTHPRRFAISPDLSLTEERRFFRSQGEEGNSLPRVFADSTPDSWGRSIIRRDNRSNRDRIGVLTEIDFLTAVDDFSRMGALRIREQNEGAEFLASSPGGRHQIPPILHLDQLSKEIRDFERDESDMVALRRLRQIGTPLGGARPKCSIIDSDGSLAIAKFTSLTDTFAVERAEVMTLKLAKLCDIDVPVARIEMSESLPVAIIKRFDRTANGRVPYISAQTMLMSSLATGATYTDIADSIRMNCSTPLTFLHELFKRISFTILVSNVDDHLKNHGFLYVGGNQWRLSPMFDVNPAPERFRELKTAISDSSQPEASIELLLENAFYFEMDRDKAASAICEMATTIKENWTALAKTTGMDRRETALYASAFVHEESTFALNLAQFAIQAQNHRKDDYPHGG